MKRFQHGRSNRLWGGLYVVAALVGAYFALLSPLRVQTPSIGDYFYLSVVALHLGWGVALFAASRRLVPDTHVLLPRSGEFLFTYTFLLFWVLYAFALNANMDYVQRFMESGGELSLAVDSAAEQLDVTVRFLPFFAVSLAHFVTLRVRTALRTDGALRPRGGRLGERFVRQRPPAESPRQESPQRELPQRNVSRQDAPWRRVVRRWALPLALLSSALSGLALPSFAAEDGIWVLGWLAMVPLFLVFSATGFWGGVFYGVVYGLFRLVLTNFWLATFSLVSLQFAVLVFLFFYGLFFPILMVFYHGAPRFRLVILPLAWTLFEYLRSSGFLGYPWALTAHSQYSVLPIIQISAVTGVWGVSFLVILVNAAFAHALVRRLDRPHLGGAPAGGLQSPLGTVGATAVGLALLAYAGSVAMAFGSAYDHNRPSRAERGESREAAEAEEAEAEEAGPSDLRTERTPAPQVRVALIQQNSDPRKHEYTRTLNSLRGLTDEALRENPDIVIWSETAFVPNIRRWGAEEPTSSRYARLVDRFLTYQSSINTWLVTGNDDYELVTDEEGREIDRLNYNAAVLFDDDGNRVDTYRKIKLVPFTEYFPYQESLPWVYQLLLEFDTHFWEPGVDRTVFEHPKFTFSTPICFEDVFPNEVRLFVLAGAEVIANMSNDYWSLTPVQAKQHFVAGIFRAVENRRPVVRATASGTTGHVDRFGRIKATVPTYSEEYLVADVTIPPDRFTIYTRWGDWFPLASGVVLILLLMVSLMRPGVTGRRNG